MGKIFVSGLINVEHSLKVDSFPINYSPIEYPFFGVNSTVSGVGYNLTKALITLGSEVDLFSIVGNDNNGTLIKTALRKEGLNVKHITTIEDEQTPESVVIFDKDGNRKIYCDLKNIQNLSMNPDLIDFDEYSFAIITNINFNRSLLPIFKQHGVKIVTDVHVLTDIDDPYNLEFMKYADFLFLSNEGCKGRELSFIEDIHHKYRNELIIMGCGDEGAIGYYGEDSYVFMEKAVAPQGVVNTVGAGDALLSAFVHFWKNGYSDSQALKTAVTFAGLKISASGGSNGFVDEETLKKYL